MKVRVCLLCCNVSLLNSRMWQLKSQCEHCFIIEVTLPTYRFIRLLETEVMMIPCKHYDLRNRCQSTDTKFSTFVSLRPYSVAGTQLRYRCRDKHTRAQSLLDTHTLTPRLRLRRQCILGLEVMKSLRRWERGSFCCLGDWGSLGTAEGEGGDEAGGAGGGWWGDVNRDISYQ